MTPTELRAICDSLNPGGQTRLAELLGWDASTVRRKLSGATKITKADALGIRKAMETAPGSAGDTLREIEKESIVEGS